MHARTGMFVGGRSSALASILTVLVLALVACSDDATAPVDTPSPVVAVDVAPGAVALARGETLRLVATPRAADGTPVENRNVGWSSNEPSVVSVSAGGLVSARKVGAAKVRAQVDGRWGEATITVTEGPAPVASVDVNPASRDLATGETLQLQATPRAADGTPVANRTVSWSSDDASVVSVTAAGLVRAMKAGETTVRASVDGRSGEASIRVMEAHQARPTLAALSPASVPAGSPGVTIVLTGTGFAPGAQILWDGAPRPAQWISATELRLTLAATQLRSEATIQIAVRNPSANGDSNTLSFVIGPVAVDRVTVSPTSASIPVGGQLQLEATAYAADGSELSGRTFTWRSSAQATASVSPTGLVTGQHVGHALITVESEGRSAQVAVSVVLPVSMVVVSPNPAAVLVNSVTQLNAVTLSLSGAVLTGRTIAWSSEDPNIATVDAHGVVTGRAKGSTRIFAQSEGKTGWSTLEVRQFAEGPVQTYVLRGVLGTPLMPSVGTTTWVDEQGEGHAATLYLSGGELATDARDSRYEQTLRLDIVVAGRGIVANTLWTDRGSFSYLLPGDRLRFESSVSGATFTAMWRAPGELVIEQQVGTAPIMPYVWVIQ